MKKSIEQLISKKVGIGTPGFTLIELLIVIVIIAALAVALFAALNPVKRLQDARNARRATDVESIRTAINEYLTDKGSLPPGLTAGMQETQIGTSNGTGVGANNPTCVMTTDSCNVTSQSCLDLTTPLASYLKNIPQDPQIGSAATTGYSVSVDTNNTITVKACGTELLSQTTCQPDGLLVNPCRPWFGAAVGGNPQAASDRISQFSYLEGQIGRQIDIFHDYHPPGNLPLNSDEIHFATRPNTYLYVNWKPASNWSDASGGNATVNAQIDQAAANIKAIAPAKIFLTIWHEPENDVSAFDNSTEQTACQNDPYFAGLKGTAGTPAQYIAMWQNVKNRFSADGVTNVVWVMNYMNYDPWECLVSYLWPGNSLVDWVTFEAYPSGATTFQTKVNHMYNLLQADNDATHDFISKPWGIAEFEDCNDTDQTVVYQKYQQMKAALDTNTFPRLKMYMAYADTGNGAGTGCLSNYSVAGTYDATEQTYFNQFANDTIFTAP